jgi:hypothetical protein
LAFKQKRTFGFISWYDRVALETRNRIGIFRSKQVLDFALSRKSTCYDVFSKVHFLRDRDYKMRCDPSCHSLVANDKLENVILSVNEDSRMSLNEKKSKCTMNEKREKEDDDQWVLKTWTREMSIEEKEELEDVFDREWRSERWRVNETQ